MTGSVDSAFSTVLQSAEQVESTSTSVIEYRAQTNLCDINQLWPVLRLFLSFTSPDVFAVNREESPDIY